MIFKNHKTSYFILTILLIVAFWIWSFIFSQVSNNILQVIFFDVGQGDGIFIETPNNRQILIDGGPDKSILEKLSQTMHFYDRRIDLVILTHPHADHVAGLIETLNYYEVGHIMTSGAEEKTATYQKWRNIIKEKNIPLTIAQAGQRIILESGVVLEILWPDQSLIQSLAQNVNNSSVVVRLVYNQSEFLLTGDIEKEVEQRLVSQNQLLESDILKIAHHGSKSSTSYNFLKAVNPQIAVISVGQDNRYKHPHGDILERLKEVLTYRTDRNGDIEILTDGILFDIVTDNYE